MKLRSAIIVIFGIIATFLLTYLFSYLEIRFGSGAFVRNCFETWACSDEEFYGAVLKGIFRSGYVYNPIIAIIVASVVSLSLKGQLLSFVAVSLVLLPFSLVHLLVGSFGMESFFQVGLYYFIGIICCFVVQKLKGDTPV